MTLCAQSTTTGLDYVQHKLNAPHVQIYNTTAAAFAAVQVGRCDAFVMDVPIIASQKKTRPSAYGPIAGQIQTNEKYGAVLSKGSKLTPVGVGGDQGSHRERHDRRSCSRSGSRSTWPRSRS